MGDDMTSRERVVATLNREEPDRVPIDFGSNFNTGVNVIAYKVHSALGLSFLASQYGDRRRRLRTTSGKTSMMRSMSFSPL